MTSTAHLNYYVIDHYYPYLKIAGINGNCSANRPTVITLLCMGPVMATQHPDYPADITVKAAENN